MANVSTAPPAMSDAAALSQQAYSIAFERSAGRDLKGRDVIRLIERDGWVQVSIAGSHRQFRHPTNRGTVTTAGHPGRDMPLGTVKRVVKRAGLVQ
jgi:predicted RNA binding protein YcfA (HicA-like mRNA interferase family)